MVFAVDVLGHWENEWFWYGTAIKQNNSNHLFSYKPLGNISLLFGNQQYRLIVWSFQFKVNNSDRKRGFAEWLNKLETVCKLQKVKNLEYLSSSALKWFLCSGLVVRLPCIMSKDTKLNNTALTQALQKSFSNLWALHITKISTRRVGKCWCIWIVVVGRASGSILIWWLD